MFDDPFTQDIPRDAHEGHTGLVPGAYHVLAGNIPVAEATREELSLSARKAFAYLIPLPLSLIVSLLEQGKGHLAWTIRWLCTGVWPTLYQLLILQGHDPFAVWRLPKPQALTLLPASVLDCNTAVPIRSS
jgi:hypothetical protein